MKYIYLPLLMTLFFLQSVFATHNRGGRIEAQYISDTSTYLITITTYTKTSSLNADRPTLDSVYLGDNNINVVFHRNSLVDLPGDIRINKYQYTYRYPGPGTYLIHFTDPNRNANIQNIPNSVTIPFYLETELVIPQGPCIANTPQLFTEPIYVLPFGKDINIARTAFDLERDSLAYSLVPCLGNNGLPISGYTLPIGVFINPVTGEFKWDGSSMVDTGEFSFAVKIEKWRRVSGTVNIFLGYIIEDFSLKVFGTATSNYGFNTSGYPLSSGGFYSSSLLPDSLFNLHVEFTDSNSGPSLQGYTSMIDSNTWTTQTTNNIATADFSWRPSIDNVSRQPYSLLIRGLPGGIDLVYMVYVEGNYSDSCFSFIGVKEISDEQNILIYPNPASGNIHISLSDTQEKFSFCIFDLKGQIIYSANKVQSPFLIPIDKLSAGMFIVRVENKKGVFNRKLVVY